MPGSEIDVADQADQTPLTHAVICNSKEVEYEMLGRYPADYKDGESRPRDLKKPRRTGPVRLSGCSAAMNTSSYDPDHLTESQIHRLAKDALSRYNKKHGLSRRGCGYVLVEALGGRKRGFPGNPLVHHLNFIARRRTQSEAENKLFFAEVRVPKHRRSAASFACSIIGPIGTVTGLSGCQICKRHPNLVQHTRCKNAFTKAV